MTDTNSNEKIILPDDLQKRMLKFFLKTSIPRKVKQERERLKNNQSEFSESKG